MSKEKNKSKETPLMKQYYDMKSKYPDAILLYRMGDFYETFGEDAISASKILGITLTKRAHGTPGAVELAGFPYHALDTYMPKLVRAGQRVAICEQLEDPKKTKKLVKRGVTELITPGVSYGEYNDDNKSNVFLAAINIEKNLSAISLLDLSTGEFLTTEGDINVIDKLLISFQPKEVIFPKGRIDEFKKAFGQNYYLYPIEEWFFEYEASEDKLKKHFDINSLKGFGIDKMKLSIGSAGAVLSYLDMTKHEAISHITSISKINESQHLLLDRFTRINLELINPIHEGGKSLVDVMDRTKTPMGSRNIRRWIAMPLKNKEAINRRLDIVEYIKNNDNIRHNLGELLSEIGDIERLTSKLGAGRITPRDINQLKLSLEIIEPIKNLCLKSSSCELNEDANKMDICKDLIQKINLEVRENAPHIIGKGRIIEKGIDATLDDLYDLSDNGKEKLKLMQEREVEATGISSLKIGFNNVFGYYIEVTKAHSLKVPEAWIRKQTLTNAERYITPELKEYEEKILGAEERIASIEYDIFNKLIVYAQKFISIIQRNANIISYIDTLVSFAEIAIENNYHKPIINDSFELKIKDGRHPVIEKELSIGEEYIANDIELDNENQQIIIITGPNMAGKSALLRQTALIVIMAQAGSFVPASSASIGYLDKVFTRVGASDNISKGESTFMVEMNEAANILNNISNRSLVLFDELGRGTSTYDGISIAWAIVEFLHENKKHKAKTLFATHYHELNEMEKSFHKIRNYNVSVKELEDKIIFMRKLLKGGVNHSFGIQVGRMAGLPKSVVIRAKDILKQLEDSRDSNKDISKNINDIASSREGLQLSFFQLDDPVLCQIRDEIKGLDINALTPLEALNKLNEIKKITGI